MTVRGLEGSPVGQFVYNLLPLTALTSQGTSSSVCDAGGYASLTAICTVSTGTLATAIRIWLQGSYDNSNWFGLPITNIGRAFVHSLGLNETTSAFTTNAMSLVAEAAVITTTVVFVGSVNAPPPYVRAAWNITGASASQTAAITCILSTTQIN
jgi:hypothetical protein